MDRPSAGLSGLGRQPSRLFLSFAPPSRWGTWCAPRSGGGQLVVRAAKRVDRVAAGVLRCVLLPEQSVGDDVVQRRDVVAVDRPQRAAVVVVHLELARALET